MTFDLDVPEPQAPEKVECEHALDVRNIVRSRIEKRIIEDPRSQQLLIGPSEVGHDCELCLGRKLAQQLESPEVAWKSFVGSAVHEKLANDVFEDDPEFLAESRVSVGKILHDVIDGTSDLFALVHNTVVDFKVVGSSTLSDARRGKVSGQYVKQVHLYGRGFVAAGYDVKDVAIYFLPGEQNSLDGAVWWAWPYDEQVALDALARAERIAKRLEAEGVDAVLPDLKKKPYCQSCRRYPKLGEEE